MSEYKEYENDLQPKNKKPKFDDTFDKEFIEPIKRITRSQTNKKKEIIEDKKEEKKVEPEKVNKVVSEPIMERKDKTKMPTSKAIECENR